MGRTEGTGAGEEEQAEVMFQNFFAGAQVQKTWNITCISIFHLRAHLLSPRMASWKEALLCLYSQPLCPWNATPGSQTSGPLPATCRWATQRQHVASSSTATYCTRADQGLHSVQCWWFTVYTDHVNPNWLFPPSLSCLLGIPQHEDSNCHERLTSCPKQDWKEPRPDDICSLTYPKPQTSMVTPVYSFDLSRLQFMCTRRALRWYFPKSPFSSIISWYSCNHFTLLRKGNVSCASQGQFQQISAGFLQK